MGRATGRDERAPLAGALLTAHQLPNRDRSPHLFFSPLHFSSRLSRPATRQSPDHSHGQLLSPVGRSRRPPVRPSSLPPPASARVLVPNARACVHAAGSTVTVSQHHDVLLRLRSVAPHPSSLTSCCKLVPQNAFISPHTFSPRRGRRLSVSSSSGPSTMPKVRRRPPVAPPRDRQDAS